MQNQNERFMAEGPVILTVEAHEAGKSLVRVILQRFDFLHPSVLYRALKKRDIKVNEKRPRSDQIVAEGDVITLYLPGDLIKPTRRYGYSIIHQKGPILIVNKEPGLAVEGGSENQAGEQTLIDLLRADVDPGCFLCHRLDRWTGGLLIAARDKKSYESVRSQMEQGLIIKRYACLVRGIPDEGQPVQSIDGLDLMQMEAFLQKQPAQSRVYIHDQKQPGDRPIVTRYRVERVFTGAGPDNEAVSELQVELKEGRTHQIRAHLAYLGHPLLGDGKYGSNAYNRFFTGKNGPLKHQELWATTLLFDASCSGPLRPFAGKTIQIKPSFDWALYHQ